MTNTTDSSASDPTAPIQVTGAPGRPQRELTDRERFILKCVLECKTNKVIAAKLGVNAVTVTNALRRMFELLNVTNRIGLVVRAFELGLVEVPASAREHIPAA